MKGTEIYTIHNKSIQKALLEKPHNPDHRMEKKLKKQEVKQLIRLKSFKIQGSSVKEIMAESIHKQSLYSH